MVSIEQLVSPTTGFVPIHRGNSTTKQYLGVTVFVDHYSDFIYIHLMTELNSKPTVEAKQAFERLAGSYNVRIRHYHADNGLFDTKAFKVSVSAARQTISFCSVNTHCQNGKVWNRIRDVTSGAQTALLLATQRCPKAIHAALWPAALKNHINKLFRYDFVKYYKREYIDKVTRG